MGALMALLEKRKTMLSAEGLFEESRKRPLPYLPEVIGVVTSPSGAVIRDILHRLRDRFPRKVLIWPVAVQGAKCAPEVVRAIEGFNALKIGGAMPRPDLLIVARGGGSVEDLWGFNEESVARAAAASNIPLISAVGHETDTTLIDFVSDKRAPTPTAAAELAVPVRIELMAWLDQQSARMTTSLSGGLQRRSQRLRDLSRALPRLETLLDGPRQRLDTTGARLGPALMNGVQRRKVRLSEAAGGLRPAAMQRMIGNERRRLDALSARMGPALERCVSIDQRRQAVAAMAQRVADAGQQRVNAARNKIEAMDRLRLTLGYEATLSRGYAVVRGDGDVVTTKKAAGKAQELEIQFADGRIVVGGKATPARKAAPKPTDQGSLF